MERPSAIGPFSVVAVPLRAPSPAETLATYGARRVYRFGDVFKVVPQLIEELKRRKQA